MHGLQIVRKGIASDPNNSTRFICISRGMEVYEGADTVAVSLSVENCAGSLYRLLTKFAVNGLNLSKIQSKPLPVEAKKKYPNDFMFYLEFGGSIHDPMVRKLLTSFENDLHYFKLHGNFTRVTE